MGFDDKYRLSVHAVITDAAERVLLVKATYGDKAWGLPGGGVDPGETLHEALTRECAEELGVKIIVQYLSGVYYHSALASHAVVFRCQLPLDSSLRLSHEHSEFRYFEVSELAVVQRIRVDDCLGFDGNAKSRRF